MTKASSGCSVPPPSPFLPPLFCLPSFHHFFPRFLPFFFPFPSLSTHHVQPRSPQTFTLLPGASRLNEGSMLGRCTTQAVCECEHWRASATKGFPTRPVCCHWQVCGVRVLCVPSIPKSRQRKSPGPDGMSDPDSGSVSGPHKTKRLLSLVLLNWKQAGRALELTHFRRFSNQEIPWSASLGRMFVRQARSALSWSHV